MGAEEDLYGAPWCLHLEIIEANSLWIEYWCFPPPFATFVGMALSASGALQTSARGNSMRCRRCGRKIDIGNVYVIRLVCCLQPLRGSGTIGSPGLTRMEGYRLSIAPRSSVAGEGLAALCLTHTRGTLGFPDLAADAHDYRSTRSPSCW